MSLHRLYFIGLLLLFAIVAKAQNGQIAGQITDEYNQPIGYATILLENTTIGTTSDEDGQYILKDIQPGVYNLSASFLGYQTIIVSEITVRNRTQTEVNIVLEEAAVQVQEVVVRSSPFVTDASSPVSVNKISSAEIYRSPGANRDISFVVQNLPGVATTTAFRNDLIVRGGAPGENKFYLDGIEIPNINHFATQGSSGGPVGMINVNFIRDVDFYTGAFPANRGNALSSIMELSGIKANPDRFRSILSLGSSDAGLTLDFPVGEKSGVLFSVRRSYLQFLFKQLALPFLPTYTDYQYKQHFDFNSKNKLTIISLGAKDDFSLNTSVNESVTEQDVFNRNLYIINNIPVSTQWNYAIGANYKHISKKGYQEIVLSRNMLNNHSFKYQNNVETSDNLLLDYLSLEIENKLRLEHHTTAAGWKLNIGLGAEHVKYNNTTFQKIIYQNTEQLIDYQTDISFGKYSAFAQASKSFFNKQLRFGAGLRTDFSDYSSHMSNPANQLSPRLNLSYYPKPNLGFSVSSARYYQTPAYTILGYRNLDGDLINKNNAVTYMKVDHLIGGMNWNPGTYSQVKAEIFYKKYNNYPFSINDSISLANLGSDYGVIGNTEVRSITSGRSYGFELSAQQKLSSSVFGLLSYTYVKSEFQDKDGVYVPSAWDNRHVLNVIAGYRMMKNWEIGAKFRYLGGAPYTPFDLALSSRKEVWDITQAGLYDYDLLNTERLPASHGLDMRIDKRWDFARWSLNVYLDIQNVYNFQSQTAPFLTVQRTEAGDPITSSSDMDRYEMDYIENVSGTVLPSIGLLIEL